MRKSKFYEGLRIEFQPHTSAENGRILLLLTIFVEQHTILVSIKLLYFI